MTFEEFLKSKGLTTEQIETITAGMAEERIYITTLENAQTRYDKLKGQKEAVDAELATANETITALKKGNADNEALQDQIKAHEATIKDLQAQAVTREHTYALTSAMTEAGVLDADYIIYKAGGLDKFTFDKDGKPVGLDDILKPYKDDAKTAHLFKTEQKPGGGYNPAGGGSPAKNPFARESYNLTEQGRLFRENPEQARALAAAAGVTI